MSSYGSVEGTHANRHYSKADVLTLRMTLKARTNLHKFEATKIMCSSNKKCRKLIYVQFTVKTVNVTVHLCVFHNECVLVKTAFWNSAVSRDGTAVAQVNFEGFCVRLCDGCTEELVFSFRSKTKPSVKLVRKKRYRWKITPKAFFFENFYLSKFSSRPFAQLRAKRLF